MKPHSITTLDYTPTNSPWNPLETSWNPPNCDWVSNVARQTLQKLQDALVSKDPPLALCTWRLEQREKRPLREQVRDTVEVCLEAGGDGHGRNKSLQSFPFGDGGRMQSCHIYIYIYTHTYIYIHIYFFGSRSDVFCLHKLSWGHPLQQSILQALFSDHFMYGMCSGQSASSKVGET